MTDQEIITNENWRQVPGFEGFYSVSDKGRVRREGPGYHCRKTRILKPGNNGFGYRHVEFSIAGKCKVFRIHYLVLLAFVGPRPEGHCTNHIDFNPSNNRLENLEYVTPKENTWHSIFRLAHGDRHYSRKHPEYLARGDRSGPRLHPERMARGENNGSAKLTEKQVCEIRKTMGISQRKLGNIYGVSGTTIMNIKNRNRWGWLI